MVLLAVLLVMLSAQLALAIAGAVRAGSGLPYRYPVAIRFLH